jgi:hypothetical protein
LPKELILPSFFFSPIGGLSSFPPFPPHGLEPYKGHVFYFHAFCFLSHRSYLRLLSHLLVRYKTFIVEVNKKFSIKVVSSIKIGFKNIMLDGYKEGESPSTDSYNVQFIGF